jgi:hypothetical protein
MFAVFVVLVLAMGGLLLRRAAFARPTPAAGTATPVRRRQTSRGAPVRSFKFSVSRAPGLLCEQASGFKPHRVIGPALRRVRDLARMHVTARFAPKHC